MLIFAPKSQYIEIMIQQEIGNAIKERRKKLGINQQTLADLASVAVNTVVAIERGEGNPQLATLLTILDTLGLQIDINIKQLDYLLGNACQERGISLYPPFSLFL